MRAVANEPIDLLERAFIEERFDALHRGHLALGVLLIDRLLAAPGSISPARLEDLGLTRGCPRIEPMGFVDLRAHQTSCTLAAYLSRVVDPNSERAPLTDEMVERALRAAGVTWPRPHLLTQVGSTNDVVLDLAGAGAIEGTCVVAEEQVAGRGRRDRTWASPPGAGLWCSVLVLAGDVPRDRWGLVSVAAGLAAREVIASAGVTAGIKWPNDVVVVTSGEMRKLAGILVQAGAGDALAVGIGINVSLRLDELPVPTATSVILAGGSGDRAVLLAGLLSALARRLEMWRSDPQALLAEFHEWCVTLGKTVEVDLPDGRHVQGEAVDIDGHGHLVVEASGKRETFSAGDVVHATI